MVGTRLMEVRETERKAAIVILKTDGELSLGKLAPSDKVTCHHKGSLIMPSHMVGFRHTQMRPDGYD